jgi:hypothetical protein
MRFVAEPQIRIERDAEGRVAVRLVGGELAVHEDDGVAVDALELDDDGLLAPLDRHVEGLRVLEDTARIVRGVHALIAVGGTRKVALRVVRERDRARRGARVRRLEGAELRADGPVSGEGDADHG